MKNYYINTNSNNNPNNNNEIHKDSCIFFPSADNRKLLGGGQKIPKHCKVLSDKDITTRMAAIFVAQTFIKTSHFYTTY